MNLDRALTKASKIFVKARKEYQQVLSSAEQEIESAWERRKQAGIDSDNAIKIWESAEHAISKINEIIGEAK